MTKYWNKGCPKVQQKLEGKLGKTEWKKCGGRIYMRNFKRKVGYYRWDFSPEYRGNDYFFLWERE